MVFGAGYLFTFALMHRFLYFLAFFGYLNVLSYEVKYYNLAELTPVAASETLLEVVLEDLLDLENSQEKEILPEIMFDDYRILVLFMGVIPMVLFFSWLLSRLYARNETINHFIYYKRRQISPGYYSFLYRYRLF